MINYIIDFAVNGLTSNSILFKNVVYSLSDNINSNFYISGLVLILLSIFMFSINSYLKKSNNIKIKN